MALVPVCTALGLGGPAAAGEIVTHDLSLFGDRNGGRSGGFLVLGGTLSFSDGTLSNFRTTGGAGSGGGAGLGGAIFINSGAGATLDNVSFSGNTAVGGLGGTTSLTGGVLNGIVVPGGSGPAGAAGVKWEDSIYLVGDGSGNGLPGTDGLRGAASGTGVGGTGGRGGDGQSGWGENPTLISEVASANSDDATMSGVLSNGALDVGGAGRLTLTGANTYAGGTAVTGATLAVNGDAALGAASGGLAPTDATLRAPRCGRRRAWTRPAPCGSRARPRWTPGARRCACRAR